MPKLLRKRQALADRDVGSRAMDGAHCRVSALNRFTTQSWGQSLRVDNYLQKAKKPLQINAAAFSK